jgi:hypothetical protein
MWRSWFCFTRERLSFEGWWIGGRDSTVAEFDVQCNLSVLG